MLLFKSVSSFCFHSSLRLISQPSNHSSIHPPAVAVAATQPKTRVLINSSVLLTSISRESIEYSVQHHRISHSPDAIASSFFHQFLSLCVVSPSASTTFSSSVSYMHIFKTGLDLFIIMMRCDASRVGR